MSVVAFIKYHLLGEENRVVEGQERQGGFLLYTIL